eukprot:TRINITY_DN2047_c0_g1_i1.p1 TRINITY_DN2047_c0_g1~~TRINITY_DN2047_c0_g1_i1.p1  ORF type:complete len:362 (-),score=66.70 TRINITY_DN2047_c0_g1_i1:76-1161(-)
MGSCSSKGKKTTPESPVELRSATQPAKVDTKAPPVQTPPHQPDPPHEKQANDSPANGENKPHDPLGLDNSDNDSILEGIAEKYDFGREIGRGGFSVVYEATDKTTGQKYAIKHIKKETMAEAEDLQLLKREIRIMKKVSHPNILKLYEVYEEDDDFYLVMELVKGKELFDRIVERGQYSERDASAIIRQLLSAIAYLHSLGIAHRDLKPENLLSYGDPETVKLVDFGFSKNFGEEKMVTSVGSPGYVAPEILTNESYDMAVDMWSVGVIIYVLLCGFPPFYADSPPDLFKKILAVEYDFDDPAWDYVSDAAKDLIRHLLVKDPKKRLTADECLSDPWVKGEKCGDTILATSVKMAENRDHL